MAEALQQVLMKAARQSVPLAIIQTRPKAIPSFVEKAIRKKKVGRYDEPLIRMTDLCGGRVITQTLAEVHAVSDFIEKYFIVDEKNSVDVSERLKPSEFGYRSIHYIVQFKRGVFPTKSPGRDTGRTLSGCSHPNESRDPGSHGDRTCLGRICA